MTGVRTALPSGAVTFLLTDIEGSTALWDVDPEWMEAALVRHDAALGEVVDAHGGVLLKSKGEGDATFSVFADPAAAVAAAIAGQVALAATGDALKVRMGLHTGEVAPRDGDYFGTQVNRAARVKGLGLGGVVVCSAATAALVAERLPADAELVDLGVHELRGLSVPERLHGLAHPALAAPALATAAPRPTRRPVPEPLDAFVGRVDDLARVADALVAHRLVTLTGLGGMGKSRLAARAAALAGAPSGSFAGAVAHVDLESAPADARIDLVVAAACGVGVDPGGDPVAALAAGIDEPLLIVLDGCEGHLDQVAALTTALLRAAPQVRCLATSREPLDAPGEAVLRLGPLGAADAGALVATRAASLGATVGTADAEAVAGRLEGIPLALELAASRAADLGVAALLRRLADDPNRLGSRRGAGPGRLDLADVLAWSWEHLADDERAVLTGLAAFADGWTEDAAEAVCGEALVDEGGRPRPHAMDDAMGTLVRRSLVALRRDGGPPRARLLEPVRRLVVDRLADPTALAAARERMVDWASELAETAYAAFHGPDAAPWRAAVVDEAANIDAALATALGIEDGGLPAAAMLAAHLTGGWVALGRWHEGRRWVETVLDRLPDPSVPVHVEAFLAVQAGSWAWRQGDLSVAEAHAVRCAGLVGQMDAGPQREHTWVTLCNLRAVIAGADGRREDAVTHARQAVATARRLDHPGALANGLHNLAMVQGSSVPLDDQIAAFEEVAAIDLGVDANPERFLVLGLRLRARRAGDDLARVDAIVADLAAREQEAPDARRGLVTAILQGLRQLDEAHGDVGALEAASATLAAGLASADAIGAAAMACQLDLGLAQVAHAAGDLERVVAHARRSIDVDAAEPSGVGHAALGLLARAHVEQGDLAAAAAVLADADDEARSFDRLVAEVHVLTAEGRVDDAADAIEGALPHLARLATVDAAAVDDLRSLVAATPRTAAAGARQASMGA